MTGIIPFLLDIQYFLQKYSAMNSELLENLVARSRMRNSNRSSDSNNPHAAPFTTDSLISVFQDVKRFWRFELAKLVTRINAYFGEPDQIENQFHELVRAQREFKKTLYDRWVAVGKHVPEDDRQWYHKSALVVLQRELKDLEILNLKILIPSSIFKNGVYTI